MLEPSILKQRAGGDLDESARRSALEDLRNRNFVRVLDAVAGVYEGGKPSPRLLDVGCAHGWFLQLASERGFVVTGIEPDRNVRQLESLARADVRHGFFPDVVGENELFDVISFNDVLEHIPDIGAALDASMRHLAPGGVLVVNAPDRTGILYRTSKVLARLGLKGSFSRMWQEGFPSPHVHYLDSRWFGNLATRKGFRVEACLPLGSVSLSGLYSRIRIDPSTSLLKAGVLTVTVAIAMPILAVAPSDIRVWLLKRGGMDA